ncbi:MAG: hypothetical protein ACRD6W_15290 [Nitrososphaerales archaeon]
MYHQELRYHPEKHYRFHIARSDLRPLKLKVGKGSGRAVFEIYRDRKNEVRYRRHYAAHLNFRQWERSWYLEINPTNRFTRDGDRESIFSAESSPRSSGWSETPFVKGLVRTLGVSNAGTSDNLFGSGDRRIVGTPSICSAAPGEPFDNEMAAIERALAEHGVSERHQLARSWCKAVSGIPACSIEPCTRRQPRGEREGSAAPPLARSTMRITGGVDRSTRSPCEAEG